MEKNVQIETGKAIGYGWETVKKDLSYFVLIALIVMLISSISTPFKDEPSKFIISLLGSILSIFVTAGYLKILLNYFDGKKLPINDLFGQTKYFFNLIGAQILIMLIIMAGFLLLIVPGIIWALKYQFTFNLIVDRDMGVIEAMKKSAELTDGVKLQLLVFNCAALGVIILGCLALGVGILVAAPVIWLADIYVYRHLLKSATL